MIFDTDVLVWLFKDDPIAIRLVQDESERAISIVTLMELVQGARSPAEAMSIRSFLRENDFDVIPINEPMSYVAAEFIDEHAHSAGLRLSDALIAATARERGEPLTTANIRHFRAIRELKLK